MIGSRLLSRHSNACGYRRYGGAMLFALHALLVLLLVACAPLAPDARTPVTVKIFAFNDFHGHLAPPPGGVMVPDPDAREGGKLVPAGGVEHLATLLGTLRKDHPHHAVVSAGDLIGATPLMSSIYNDEPTIEVMNRLGLDFNGVGNHEFDRGTAELLRLQNGGCAPDGCKSGVEYSGARFKFLAANVIVRNTRKPLFPAYGIKDFGGVRVAFAGVTLQGTSALVPAAGIAGVDFIDEVDAVNRLIPEIKAQGVAAIVVLLHQGGAQRGGHYNSCADFSGPVVEIARRLDPAVAVVVSGHTHQSYICRLHGKLVTSAGSYGRLLTEISMTLDARTGGVLATDAGNHVVATHLAKDPALTELIARYAAGLASQAHGVVGRIAESFSPVPDRNGESALGKLIADAQLEATATAGAVLAFMNPGGVRAPLVFRENGAVTYGELFAVHPFGNTLVTMTLTGAQLLEALELQWLTARPRPLYVSRGFSYEWDPRAPPGRRIVAGSVSLHGKALEPAARYRVTVNNFLAEGGDGFSVFTQGEQQVKGNTDIDAMTEYLGHHAAVRPDPSARVIARSNP